MTEIDFNAECRMQSAKGKILQSDNSHSAFCIVHFALNFTEQEQF